MSHLPIATPTVPAASQDTALAAVYPLAPNQRQLWLFEQLTPGTAVYNVPGAIRIEGRLDRGALESSLSDVFARHEALRLVLTQVDGEPAQRVLPPGPLMVPIQELDGDPAETLAKEARRPFDLKDRLARAILWRLGETQHVLQLTVHHLITDGWSMGVIMRDLVALYEARVCGTPASLPPLHRRYGELAAARTAALHDGAYDADLAFWRTTLAGAPADINLPADRPRPRVASHCGGVVVISAMDAVMSPLVELARTERVSTFAVIMTAWQALLSRLSGQQDLVSGFLSANRDPETASLVGYFVDVLPLRTQLSDDTTFRGLLRATADDLGRAVAHANAPLSAIGTAVQTVAVQQAPTVTLRVCDLRFSYDLVDSDKAKFDLSLFVTDQRDRFRASIEYSSDLFDQTTVRRIAGTFTTLLAGITADPDSRVSRLPLLDAAERQRIVIDFNDTAKAYTLQPIPRLFEAQVDRTPQAIAVSEADTSRALTYQDLNRLANRVGHQLRSQGAGPGTRVGICAERSLELLIGVLATLKTGAAYVPLEPESPPARLQMMIADAELTALLTTEHSRAALLAVETPIIAIDAYEPVSTDDAPNLRTPVTLADPAYLIYTSGSTGVPKGVVNLHRGIANRIVWMQERFPLGPADRLLQKTPFGFDVSVLELLWPILHGAQLVMARPGGHRDSGYLIDTIVDGGITTAHFVPSMLRLFLETEGVERCRGVLRRVLSSGEAMSGVLQQQFFARLDASLHNFYGPTEAAVDVTWWDCRRDESAAQRVPIGRPIANTRIYILDAAQQPVPVGIVGQIYIGGVNVARGYWKRAELTERAFVADPFVREPEARLFKTGDLGRFRDDGAIEYEGRLDRQVKIRGNRIELGEVEAALKRHAGVADALVVGRQQQLVAYVTPSDGPSTRELREFVRTLLPEFMVPSHVIFLDGIPLNANGKVDVAALPSPDGDRTTQDRRDPQGAIERTLVEIWSTVLETAHVGVDDHFFERGGDSLRILEVIQLARQRGLRLTVGDLLRCPTISALARVAVPEPIPGAPEASAPFAFVSSADRVKLPEDLEDAYPLSMLQAGLVYHSQTSPEYGVYVTSHHVRAPLDLSALTRAVQQVTDRHAMLRASFHVSDYSEPLQLVWRSAAIPIATIDWTSLSEAEQEQALTAWIAEQRGQRFAWEQPPLCRVFVHRRSAGTFQFSLVEPLLDGWSVSLVCAEILGVYAALLDRQEPRLPAILGSYRDYVRLEREARRSADHREFWAQRLHGFERTFLPRWPHAERIDPHAAGVIRRSVQLVPKVDDALRRTATSLAVPLKSVLLAAHVRAISVLCGTKRIVTGLMANGRLESPGSADVVGLFLNVLPLAIELPTGSWADLIRAVAEAEAQLMPYRRYPLAQMRIDQGGASLDSVFNFIHFRAYARLATRTSLTIVDTRANDQTYFPITAQFSLNWQSGALRSVLDFDPREISSNQMTSIAGVYERILEQLAASPDARYAQQAPLPDRERTQMTRWNATDAAEVLEDSYLTRFERQVDATPLAIAVIDERESLTYADLNQRANRLARRLLRLRVGPDDVVALLAERSAAFLVAILAVHKAGGAYLPLDPAWPSERIRDVLARSRAAVVLYEPPQPRLVEPDFDKRLPWLDLRAADGDADERANSRPLASADHLAYVIYTSGSTGAPKGVMIAHAGMLNHLLAKIETLQLATDSVLAQTASQCFDISVWQFLAPLLVGGRVEIADRATAADPVALGRLLRDRQVTVFETVPTMLRALLEVAPSQFASVRWVLVTGEAFPVDLCQRWRTRHPRMPIVNAYGPTECSDDVTHHVIRPGMPIDNGDTVPIGRPIRNTRIVIVDEDQQPTPIGVPGELLVAGVGVGRGYLGDEARTREAFVPVLEALAGTSDRLYRTGDRARFLPDGTIQYLGRFDRQLKVRGYRLEAGEIEGALRTRPTIQEAVVGIRSIGGEDTLVAYVVPVPNAVISPVAVRHALAQRLPEYAVPSLIITVAALPLTSTGKIDMTALAAIRSELPDARPAYVAPRTDRERLLATLWARTLEIERVGIHDRFFDLGGHSLLAMVMVGVMSQTLQRDISVRTLLAHPTIADLLATLDREDAASDAMPVAWAGFGTASRLTQVSTTQRRIADPIDAAALGYVPASSLSASGLSRQQLPDALSNTPIVRGIFETTFGRIGQIMLPIISDELYANQGRLLALIDQGVTLAHQLGARAVTLTGLIPSATEYGRLASESAARKARPTLSTGHATTSAAVAMTLARLLAATRRSMNGECVGCLGLGSIGRSSLRLLLRVLPHPREIHLCDLYREQDRLAAFGRELCHADGFVGRIHLHAAEAAAPDSFYDATLIIGATNVARTLDVARIAPGTLVVDDSAPHCFDIAMAGRRMLESGDVLFSEGGLLALPAPLRELRYVPTSPGVDRLFAVLPQYRAGDEDIMGCIFSSLLSVRFVTAVPTLGLISIEQSESQYRLLRRLQIQGAAASCLGAALPDAVIDRFRSRFGGTA